MNVNVILPHVREMHGKYYSYKVLIGSYNLTLNTIKSNRFPTDVATKVMVKRLEELIASNEAKAQVFKSCLPVAP